MSLMGQNENPPLGGLCQLSPAPDIQRTRPQRLCAMSGQSAPQQNSTYSITASASAQAGERNPKNTNPGLGISAPALASSFLIQIKAPELSRRTIQYGLEANIDRAI
jgi:hypothetical protein